MNQDMAMQRDESENTLKVFTKMRTAIENIISKTEELAFLSVYNKQRKDSVVNSVKNISSVSQEVADITNTFRESSKNIGKGSEQLLKLVQNLETQINKFKL